MKWIYRYSMDPRPVEVFILAWHSNGGFASASVIRTDGGAPFIARQHELTGVVDDERKLP